MRQPGAAARWTAARWGLREVLSRYLGGPDPAEIGLRGAENGKPELVEGGTGLRFNLSHSEGLALVAVCEREVGVDIERMAPGRDFLALAKRALDAEAVAAIQAAAPEDREEAFYAEWSRHEALVKCLGTGLAQPLPDQPVRVESIAVAPGYAAAVAVAGEAPLPLRAFVLSSPSDEERTNAAERGGRSLT